MSFYDIYQRVHSQWNVDKESKCPPKVVFRDRNFYVMTDANPLRFVRDKTRLMPYRKP